MIERYKHHELEPTNNLVGVAFLFYVMRRNGERKCDRAAS